MNAHRIKTKVNDDGTLHLDNLPFQPGQSVEVVIIERAPSTPSKEKTRYPLRGEVLEYKSPFDPVAEEDWSVTQ